MRIRVLYFGMLKDFLQSSEEAMELPPGATIASVFERLEARALSRQEASGLFWGALAVAVNQEYAGRERVLVEGDEVALLPPVSGGKTDGLGR